MDIDGSFQHDRIVDHTTIDVVVVYFPTQNFEIHLTSNSRSVEKRNHCSVVTCMYDQLFYFFIKFQSNIMDITVLILRSFNSNCDFNKLTVIDEFEDLLYLICDYSLCTKS